MNKVEINHKYSVGDEVWTTELCSECIDLCDHCGKGNFIYRHHSKKSIVKEITTWRIIGRESDRSHVEYYLVAENRESQVKESLVFGSQEEADACATKLNAEHKDE